MRIYNQIYKKKLYLNTKNILKMNKINNIQGNVIKKSPVYFMFKYVSLKKLAGF
jgi:hypothetical protein